MTDWYIAAVVTFLAGMFAGAKLVFSYTHSIIARGLLTDTDIEEMRENYRMRMRLKVLQGKLK